MMGNTRCNATIPDAQKLALIDRWEALQRAGMIADDAAEVVGQKRPTLFRWRTQLLKKSGRGRGATDQAAGAPESSQAPSTETNPTRARTGRPPAWSFTPEECRELRTLRLVHESLDICVRKFLEADCGRPETRAWLERYLDRAASRRGAHHWPAALRRAAHVSAEERAAWRGERTLAKHKPSVSRGLYWIDAAGRTIPMMANDVWESDDMSINEPFSYLDPATGQMAIGRQILFTQDVYSRQFLATTLVGRSRDAYRIEDLTDHILEAMDRWGMPLVWRIEQGIWKNTAFDGVRLDSAHARSLGFEGERWSGRKIGGLSELIQIDHQWSSNGKGGIEGSFNLLQALTAHASEHIGRHRGEFEAAKKHHRQAQSGQAGAIEKFWPAEECADAVCAAMEEFNSLPKQRAAFGPQRVVPLELFRERPAKREIPDGERWRFHPVKALTTVRQGVVQVTDDKYYKQTFRFLVNGVTEDLFLEHGHRVVIAFHPAHPEQGCTVLNAEFGPRNREGWAMGEKLLVARPLSDVPQFRLDGRATESQTGESLSAVRREHRQVREAGIPGRPGTRRETGAVSHYQDPDGLVVRGRDASPRRPHDAQERAEMGSRNTRPAGRREIAPPALGRLAELEAEAEADFYL